MRQQWRHHNQQEDPMSDNLSWKNVSSANLTGEDARLVKALEDARAAFEAHVQNKNGPCLFTYKRGGIAYAKQNGNGGRQVTEL
jgi:hypothetical protein